MGFLVFLIGCNDGIGGDHARIGGELVPSCLRTRHVKISCNLQSLFGDRFREHACQTREFKLVGVQIILNGSQLFHSLGHINFREHGFDLCFRQTAVQKGLDLREQSDVLDQRALVHIRCDLIEIGQQTGLVSFRSHAVFAQLLVQCVNVCCRLLDIILPPDRHHNGSHRLRVFQRSGTAVFVVLEVQFIQSRLTFGSILDQHDQSVLLVILRIDLCIDGSHAFSGGDHCILIDRYVRIALTAGVRTGNFCFHLLSDGFEAVRFSRS